MATEDLSNLEYGKCMGNRLGKPQNQQVSNADTSLKLEWKRKTARGALLPLKVLCPLPVRRCIAPMSATTEGASVQHAAVHLH
jgi:hypothetical protein